MSRATLCEYWANSNLSKKTNGKKLSRRGKKALRDLAVAQKGFDRAWTSVVAAANQNGLAVELPTWGHPAKANGQDCQSPGLGWPLLRAARPQTTMGPRID
jgi:hypothetical protein